MLESGFRGTVTVLDGWEYLELILQHKWDVSDPSVSQGLYSELHQHSRSPRHPRQAGVRGSEQPGRDFKQVAVRL